MQLPGVGVKTAACVVLFCLRKPSFAVDTHVLRMAGWLGWIPARTSLSDAFHHLDATVPDPLKYALHQLFIKHGQTCVRCSASTSEGGDGWAACVCPLEELLKRVGKKAVAVKAGANGDAKVAVKLKLGKPAAKKQEAVRDGEHNRHGIA